MTKQRAAILKTIRDSHEHLSAMELYEIVRREMPNIVLATIYNNLNALEEMGEIRRLHIEGGTDRYDKSLRPHAHLVCDNCGKIQDASVDGIEAAIEKTVKSGINSYELNIHWNCCCKEN